MNKLRSILAVPKPKIAVFRALQLGDLLVCIPAIRALRKSYPNASITIIGLPWQKILLERFPQYFDEFISFPGWPGLPEQSFDATSILTFLKTMQEKKYDLLLQMQGDGSIVNEMIMLCGARQCGGFYSSLSFKPNTELFVEYPNYGNEIYRMIKLMKFYGIKIDGDELEFPLYESDYQEVDNLQIGLEQNRYVCIHPGANDPERRWPVENFVQVGDLCARLGYKVVLTGVINESYLTKKIAHLMKYPSIDLAGKTTLGGLAALIKKAKMLICNNTGVCHVSAALKIQSTIILLKADKERWSPLNLHLHQTIDWKTHQDISMVLSSIEKSLSSY